MAPLKKTLMYVTRFQCIADRCEDTCCQGMHVLVSNDDRNRLRQVVSKSPHWAAELEKNLQPVTPPFMGYPLELAKDENDACRLLSQGLCSLQKDLGPDALPHTCARFPKELHARTSGIEEAGTLACPEMARLCLLSEDSLDWVETQTGSLTAPLTPKAEHAEASAWRARGAAILAQKGKTLSEKWRELLEAFHEPSEAFSENALDTVLAVLVGLRARENRRYNAFNEAVMLTYQLAVLEENPQGGMLAGPALASKLQSVFQARKERFDARLGRWVEPLLSRYAQNHWLQVTFEAHKPAFAPVFDAVLQSACVRFLLVGHPVLNELLALPDSGDAHRPLLERSVVQTVQWFSKYIERDHDLWDEVRKHLSQRHGASALMAHARALARLV